MKLYCNYCNHTWHVSRLLMYIKYLLNTKEIESRQDYGKQIHYINYTCPQCQNKIAYMLYMRRVRQPQKDKKVKKL